MGRGRLLGKNVSKSFDYAIGGWQINTIAQLGTGTPFNVNANGNNPNTQADQIAPAQITHSVTRPYFTTTAFRSPPTVEANNQTVYTRPGNSEVNQLYGPGTETVDVSIFKTVPIVERVNAELHAEAYNVLNTPQFTNPDGNLNDGNYGLITGTRLASERQLEFAVRFTF